MHAYSFDCLHIHPHSHTCTYIDNWYVCDCVCGRVFIHTHALCIMHYLFFYYYCGYLSSLPFSNETWWLQLGDKYMWHVKTSPHKDLLRAKYELSTQIKSIKKWTISGQNQQTIAHTRQSDATAITFHKNVRTRLVSESASRLIINLNTAMNFSRQLYQYNWKRVQEKKNFSI